jgi:hypothetical protein
MTSSVGLMKGNNIAMHTANVGARPHTNLDQSRQQHHVTTVSIHVTKRCCPPHSSFLSCRTDNSCLPPLRTSVTRNALRHPFPLAVQCVSTLYLERPEFALGVISYLDCTMPFLTEICTKRHRFGTPLYSTNNNRNDRTVTRPAGAVGLCLRSK